MYKYFLLKLKIKLVKLRFMKRNTIFILFSLILVLAFTGCQSTQIEITDDMTEQQLIKLAQESYDEGNIKASETYYQAIIDRFGTNMGTRIMAEFELAHILVKDKKYDEAKPMLEQIISYFTEETMYEYPVEYKKLAEIDLAKITEAENK